MNSAIRVVAIIEASTITGPAKNLIRFCRLAREPMPGEPALDISIATFCRGKGAQTGQNAFIDAVRAADIGIDIVPEDFAFDPKVPGLLGKALAKRNPAIVQSHGVKSHFLVRACGFNRRYRWLAFHHGYTAEDLKMRTYNQLDRWSLRAAPRIVTVCGPFASELTKIGVPRSRIEVLPNSIEPAPPASPADVEALRARLGIRPGERVILSIGRLSREKGHIDLLGAAGALSQNHPELQFRIVMTGDGPERANLENAARQYGDRIIFTGHVGNVRSLYGLADVLVLPSYSEGSPNVLLEAMAARVPIVATPVGGVCETVGDGITALLSPVRDPEGLAVRIANILDDAELSLRLRDNGVAEAGRRSPQGYRQALTRVYESLVSG